MITDIKILIINKQMKQKHYLVINILTIKIINIGIANTSGLRDKKDIIQDNLIINYFIINSNFRYRLYFSYNKINYNKID